MVREGKDGFYYHVPKDLNISSSANVSALVTLQNDLLLTQGKRDGRRMTVLGIEENAEGTHSLQLDENGNVRISISPNEDGNKDLVEYKTVALRNIENLRATVYAASDTEHKNPLWKELHLTIVRTSSTETKRTHAATH